MSQQASSLKARVSQYIYHEKQEPDSNLCAQHCLNSLLQENIFSATDLADLGRQLDELEAQAHGVNDIMHAPHEAPSTSGRGKRQRSPPGVGQHGLNADRSRNMDDSGFFSSQVMDEALKPFHLQLVRWRSERMRPYQAAPEHQQAFVFNFQQHWFCIRRFGHSKHFFFDVNSFHPEPKHVSPLYLGLQIDQAEHEGYSVFVVVSGPQGPTQEFTSATLPPCQADEEVYAIAEEARVALGGNASMVAEDRASQALVDDETLFTSSGQGPSLSSGFGNEDEELNKAIEASLQGYSGKSDPLPRTPAPEETYEDPELAAAIAASLETAEGGPTKQMISEIAADAAKDDEDAEEEEEAEDDEPLTADDIRKARLARFG